MSRRFFDPQDFRTGTPVSLGSGASHHIGRVLRMKPDEELVVFNGRGGEFRARIVELSKQAVTVEPLEFIDCDRAPALAIHLGLPLIKGDRMDYALQKATEMGAASISLVDYRRNEVRLNSKRMEKKRSHWEGVIISACEQSGLNRIPVLTGPVSLSELLQTGTDLKLIGHPGSELVTEDRIANATSATLLTGPEGGFTDEEIEAALSAGFRTFTLGERVLRAETAPVALMAVLLTLGT